MSETSILIMQIVFGAVSVTLVGILVMTVLFGVAMATVLKNKKGIAGLLLVGASLPVLVAGMSGRINFATKANERIVISNIEWEKADTGWLISFDSNKATLIYLEWKNGNKVWPIVPTTNPVPEIRHVYWINDEMANQGEIWIVTQNGRLKVVNKRQ